MKLFFYSSQQFMFTLLVDLVYKCLRMRPPQNTFYVYRQYNSINRHLAFIIM